MSMLRLRMEVKSTAIMREIAVPEDYSLAFLHAAVQSVFGWLDYHMHEFVDAKGVHYCDRDCEPSPFEDVRCMYEDEKTMKLVFKKPGDVLDYCYDFGDGNEVKITLLGRVTTVKPEHFSSKGTDMVEDSASSGGTEGVVGILRGKKSPEQAETVAWLKNAFRKSPEAVLHEPSADEIFYRIYRLVHLVDTAEGYSRPCYQHESYWPCLESM